MGFFDEGGTGNPVDVPKLLDNDAPAVIAAIVEHGALVSLGKTSDGGALGVTVTVDGRWRREYFRDGEELMRWLAQAEEAVADEVARLAASSGGASRSRRSRAR